MAYAHATLTEAELGPAVVKMAGEGAPPPMRAMVARGVAPLPPRDMVVALYHFWVTNDPELAETAARTVEGLPAPVIEGALADPRLPGGVLDLLGRKLARKEDLLDKVVRHPNVHDETLIGVARVCPEGVCDTLADNQVRWLECGQIVASLYQNRHCRMSVIHRMLELAERQGLELKIPAMDEIRIALKDDEVDESRDEMFSSAIAAGTSEDQDAAMLARLTNASVDDELDLPEMGAAGDGLDGEGEGEAAADEEGEAAGEEEAAEAAPVDVDEVVEGRERRLQQLIQMKPVEKIRAALLGDKYDRSVLVRDSNKVVAMATIKSPKIRDDEIVGYSTNRALSHDVVRYIANRREWVKLYAVKLNLVMNPKTPLSRAMTLLAHLNRMDVQKVARSKNIPSALAKAAKRKVRSRR
jgi:hypothetical protein